ncbi:hypothetical protein RclHR1_17160003 [Rhizophagus clarus]|uniref:Replication origin-binding protein domain-containing protein n=1 Tax=Rhizophagus clarus TaxID=94130 RepID=A0A2Z6QJI8_9GLOM|nr:hypothetical protein RclHR1_17160003 [Rhizophagus clarus]GET01091.1 hypothetical protein GLOIN_2v1791232 [Rhizophagus clarus]
MSVVGGALCTIMAGVHLSTLDVIYARAHTSDRDDYESNYVSDNEEAYCTSTNTIKTPLVQPPNVNELKINVAYTLRQEKFNDNFSSKDLLNAIRKIFLSPPRDMSDEKGSLEYLPIYSFLFPNKKGSCLYNTYDRNEVKNKLVIKIDQDDQTPKFSVADDILEVYGLPGIHECINGQKPLRAVININTTQEDMEVNGVKSDSVFIRICCSFIRALYRILDCDWEDILKGLVIATSSDSSKCSYHLLYALTLLIDHNELKAFTELVYTLTGEKFGRLIDRGLPGQNFNLRLISLAKKDHVKCILLSSITNGWNEFDHTRVQPPSNLGLKVRPRMLSIEKNNSPLKIIIGHNILQKCTDLVLQKYSNYLKDYTIEEKDSENFVYFNQKASLEYPQCKRIHDKDQQWFSRVCASNGKFIIKCFWQGSDEPGEVKASSFPKAFVKFPSWVKYNDPFTATKTYEERYVRPLSNEGDIYIGSSWETGKTYILENLSIPIDINLLVLFTRHSYSNAVTTRLDFKSYCDIDVSIIAQAQSHLVRQSIEKLYKLVQDARRIIVMDNDLTDLNIEWIKALRKDKLFSIIHNTFQPQKGKTFRLAPNKETVLVELWNWAKHMASLPFESRTSVSLICHLRKGVQGIVRALKTDFPELRIKEYHGKSDPVEKAHDFSNIEESWKDINLVAYTSTLKIRVSCINPKFEQAFCLFNSYIETNARMNQMLFRMRCIKDYICHIEQRFSNVPITEKGLFQ